MKLKLLILGMILSLNLHAQDLMQQSLDRIDGFTRFENSLYIQMESVKAGAKDVTTIAENKSEETLPHIICTHDDGLDVLLIHNKKKVLAVKFIPANTLGLEKILIYLNHKKTSSFEYRDNKASGRTVDGKYFLYNAEDFSLTLMPIPMEKFLEEVKNYFK